MKAQSQNSGVLENKKKSSAQEYVLGDKGFKYRPVLKSGFIII